MTRLNQVAVSGGTACASPVFLFEEFVPLKYRQQLSEGVQNKRMLAPFFSPGNTKRWKQAATLNGRHYLVGHVRRSLSSRETESEGHLRGNNSSTEVISFGRDGPIRRDITHPGSGPPGSSQGPSSTRHLFSLVRCAAGGNYTSFVYPSHANRSPSRHPSGNKRRFRHPTGLPRSPRTRTSDLAPSQAEDAESETPFASYSHDELNSININSRKMTKEERRRVEG